MTGARELGWKVTGAKVMKVSGLKAIGEQDSQETGGKRKFMGMCCWEG